MGENVEQNVFVTMLQTKIAEYVLRQLELQKDIDHAWTVKELRECLRQYIGACERSKHSHTTTVDTEIKSGNREGLKYERQSTKPAGRYGYNFSFRNTSLQNLSFRDLHQLTKISVGTVEAFIGAMNA